MRICLIGDIRGNIDEGMKNVANHLYNELSKNNDVRIYHPFDLFTFNFWNNISQFRPDIIHYIPGPSLKSFILMKFLGIYFSISKTIMSATFPYLSSFSKLFVPFLKPDLILVQSDRYEKIFKILGCKTEFLQNGVDIDKFYPADPGTKKKLRKKYGLDKDKFIILHVGHIKENRGIRALAQLQDSENQVIIIGSTSTGIEEKLKKDIEKEGVIVITKYLKDIEDYYRLSDCYVFTVIYQHSSVQIPLSVLESMACNLPVISTKFGALPEIFKESNGFFYINNTSDIPFILHKIKIYKEEIKTQEKVTQYSWERVSNRLEEIYKKVLNERD